MVNKKFVTLNKKIMKSQKLYHLTINFENFNHDFNHDFDRRWLSEVLFNFFSMDWFGYTPEVAMKLFKERYPSISEINLYEFTDCYGISKIK